MDQMDFCIEGNTIIEITSGMKLCAVDFEGLPTDACWINGWFKVDSELYIQYFRVIPDGKPTYSLAGKAVDYWGQQVLGVPQADANEMSPEFGNRLLIPAVENQYI